MTYEIGHYEEKQIGDFTAWCEYGYNFYSNSQFFIAGVYRDNGNKIDHYGVGDAHGFDSLEEAFSACELLIKVMTTHWLYAAITRYANH